MNNVTKKLLAASLLLSCVSAQATNTFGQSFFLPHAQNGTAHELLGWTGATHKFDMTDMYGTFRVQLEGQWNTKKNNTAAYINLKDSNTLVFGPRKIASTSTAVDTDVFGLNFLLEEDAKNTVTFAPRMRSFLANFSVFVGLNEWVDGLYFNAHLPLQYNRWEVVLSETNNTAGGDGNFAAGSVGLSGTTYAATYTKVADAFKGNKNAGVGLILNNWSYGRIDGAQTKTKVGDIQLTLGYDFINRENSHFGIGVRGLIGCGGKSTAAYVLEPVIGNAGRHGVGGVADAHAVLWSNDDDASLTGYLTGSATHLFANAQKRSYDLTNSGNWSRYLLVKKITTISTTGASTFGSLDNMINVGTLNAKIGVPVVYDASLMFKYMNGNITAELGYNVAGRSAEKFGSFIDTITGTYGLYGVNSANIGAALTTAVTNTIYNQSSINGDTTAAGATAAEVITGGAALGYLITNASLDTASAVAPAALAHSVFGGVNYNWMDCDYMPGVGVYGKAEFSGIANNTHNLWAFGVQGNVSF